VLYIRHASQLGQASEILLSLLLLIDEAGRVPIQLAVSSARPGLAATLETYGVDIHLADDEPAFVQVAFAPLDTPKEGTKIAWELVPIADLAERGVLALGDDSDVHNRHP